MVQDQILKNHWRIGIILVNFLLRTVASIKGFMVWIGYMHIFQIIILISVMFVFFSGIQFMTYIIKKSASHIDDYIIEIIITIFVVVLVDFILRSLPFNAIAVIIFASGSFGCIFSIAFFFPKLVLKKDDIRKRYNIFFITISTTFVLAFILFDLVYLILLYALGILQIVLFNKKYNIWKKISESEKQQNLKRIIYILFGANIFLFIFLALFMIFYSY